MLYVPSIMRTWSSLFGALPVLCGLFAAALFLPGCDSGANFSSLDDIALNDGVTAKARAWYSEQLQFEISGRLSKVEGDEDSLALLAFIEKFPPDWNEAVVLSLDGTEETLVLTTTLGEYTDERYDSTMYHVRTLVMDMEPSGDVASGVIVAFSSEQELSKLDFDNYVEQYIVKDFGETDMTVSRYTVLFEGIDAYLYRLNNTPIELDINYISRQLGVNELDKYELINSIGKNIFASCYIDCYVVEFGEICSGPISGQLVESCGGRQLTTCVVYCSFPNNTNSNDNSNPNNNNENGSGGDGYDNENDTEDNDKNPYVKDKEKCNYNTKICNLIKEYKKIGVPEYKIPHAVEFITFLKGKYFNWNELNGHWSDGSEYGKHNPYGVFDTNLLNNIDNIRKEYGKAIKISSGYRCPQGNTDAGSEYPTTSKHMFGHAIDMVTNNNASIFNKLVEVKEQVASNLEHESMSTYPKDGHLHLELP